MVLANDKNNNKFNLTYTNMKQQLYMHFCFSDASESANWQKL